MVSIGFENVGKNTSKFSEKKRREKKSEEVDESLGKVKEIKYDMRLKHLIPNFLLQIPRIFLAGMVCFYILVGIGQTYQLRECTFDRAEYVLNVGGSKWFLFYRIFENIPNPYSSYLSY